jgi:asparagine synthase (glutamine-hydrolysing)
LRALAGWGPDAARRCNGLFAFAALDRERRRLLLVRDRFGVKPLYFARRPEGLWFASEMRALLAAGVEPRPRLDVLHHFVTHGWANRTATPIEGIHRLLAEVGAGHLPHLLNRQDKTTMLQLRGD